MATKPIADSWEEVPGGASMVLETIEPAVGYLLLQISVLLAIVSLLNIEISESVQIW